MYSNLDNLVYLTFLYLILEKIQMVNKSFESNSVDISKLLKDLTNLVVKIFQPRHRFLYNTKCLFWL